MLTHYRKFCLSLLCTAISFSALADQCPNVSAIAPDSHDHWVTYGWHSIAPAVVPNQYQLTFAYVTLVSALNDGFMHAYCVYNDAYENGLITLVPITTQSHYTPFHPTNMAAWSITSQGQMAKCVGAVQDCTFELR